MSKKEAARPEQYFASPDFAENAFYSAIRRGDLAGVMEVWSEEEELVCIHPTGQKFHGLKSIRESWQSVLAQGLRVTPLVLHRWQSTITAVHLVQETLYVGDDNTPHGPLLATHVFLRGVGGWRMVLHQAGVAAQMVQDGSTIRILH